MKTIVLRWLVPLAGGALALFLIFRLYGSLDFDKFIAGLRGANLFWIAVLAGAILLEQILNGWKWRQILFDIKPISTRRLTGAMLAGYGANILVPVGISPLVRAWLVARLDGLKMATVLSTTIVARFIDGVVFALFAGVVALAGQVPQVEGSLRLGLSIAGLANIVIFGGLLWVMFRFRTNFAGDTALISRGFDWVMGRIRVDGAKLRRGLSDGVIWPRAVGRRIAVVLGAVLAKLAATTHFIWAGLAVGITLAPMDYLFLMVFTGFVMVLGRFVRIPGSFVFGAGFALQMLGVPDEPALLMILFSYITTIILMVGIGLVVLWQSGIDISRDHLTAEMTDAE